ncbi:DUF3617 domain-containing protein [Novosphingobium album (ex Hu et al. 2023)]|uniref:DUF3617 domain-containing protein n=1 Tax=Novosphingobium album (ex Hu et al. 2023) TaxID=2930093 RepID=A0ABT0B6B8_9SPHN|nr:DUF3617 domain-containing protein [Novosphingobium album (ex Hu et al. 2023)]MCJ2180581.1 DUF3617 domain-containing protein [Novosphingobium album (ex Hu et al. 2023)]
MRKVSMADVMRKSAAGATMGAVMLTLAACGSKEEAPGESTAASGETRSADDVAHEAAKLNRPKPGSYKQTIEILDMEIPGLPKEAAGQMKAMTGKPQVQTICITDADTEKGYKEMLQNVGKGGDCTYSKFDVAGGRLDAQMHCKTEGQGEATMTMNGTVSETGSDVMVGMDVTGGQQPMGAMKMKMHLTTERVGDCAS